MNVILEVLVVLVLLLIFIQDMRFRAIHIVLPILLACIGSYLFYKKNLTTDILFYNLLFLGITFFGLYTYLFIKRRKFTNPLAFIGIGDFLYFIAVIPYFSMTNYILYFTTGMVFSIIVFMFIKSKVKTNLVPLAGLLALYMLLLKGLFYLCSLSFFETKII